MAKTLVIVESPAKAQTINQVSRRRTTSSRLSMGHVRDLPEKQCWGSTSRTTSSRTYESHPRARSRPIKPSCRKQAQERRAGHPGGRPRPRGRGHLPGTCSSSSQDDNQRIFRVAVQRDHRARRPEAACRSLMARSTPNMVDAQQMRRVLDRLVGYKISPLLRKKIGRGLLRPGRVQSIALRLIVRAGEGDPGLRLRGILDRRRGPAGARASPAFTADAGQGRRQEGQDRRRRSGQAIVCAELQAPRLRPGPASRSSAQAQGTPAAAASPSTLQQDGVPPLLRFPVKKTMFSWPRSSTRACPSASAARPA
ncbi:MAG: DNA topoisomerase [Candidatus Moduliflexus flocculans]|nr:DNA topoisomerase [Candidatus Moduliflexus flocculans]